MRVIGRVILLWSLVMVGNSPAGASPITVTINTAPISGAGAQLAFDFIDGGSPANSVTISNFSTDGALGASIGTGNVNGSLPGAFVLSDTAFFNELLTDITLGTSLSFTFDATSNAAALGSVPDSFSFFLLNAATGLSLFPTTDPTGADSLLQFDVTGGGGSLALFSAPGSEATISLGGGGQPTPVPEPATLILLTSGLVACVGSRRHRQPR